MCEKAKTVQRLFLQKNIQNIVRRARNVLRYAGCGIAAKGNPLVEFVYEAYLKWMHLNLWMISEKKRRQKYADFRKWKGNHTR